MSSPARLSSFSLSSFLSQAYLLTMLVGPRRPLLVGAASWVLIVLATCRRSLSIESSTARDLDRDPAASILRAEVDDRLMDRLTLARVEVAD
jgi:hypothetical protein